MSAKENQANQFAVKKVRAAKGQAFQTTKKWKFFMTFTFFSSYLLGVEPPLIASFSIQLIFIPFFCN